MRAADFLPVIFYFCVRACTTLDDCLYSNDKLLYQLIFPQEITPNTFSERSAAMLQFAHILGGVHFLNLLPTQWCVIHFSYLNSSKSYPNP